MHKVLCILLLFSLLFVGCSKNKNLPINQNTDTENSNLLNTEYLFLIANTNENLISIPIPLAEGFGDVQINFIKNFIENKIFNLFEESFDLELSETDVSEKNRDYSDCYIAMNSEISYISDDKISIIFTGLFNKKNTAHPIHCFFSINFNPMTLEIIPFSENYSINKNLYNTFATEAEKGILQQCNGEWPDGWGVFSDELCSESDFLEGMQAEEEFHYFYTKNGIGISYPVPYSLGNHIEIIIPYSKVKTEDGSMS